MAINIFKTQQKSHPTERAEQPNPNQALDSAEKLQLSKDTAAHITELISKIPKDRKEADKIASAIQSLTGLIKERESRNAQEANQSGFASIFSSASHNIGRAVDAVKRTVTWSSDIDLALTGTPEQIPAARRAQTLSDLEERYNNIRSTLVIHDQWLDQLTPEECLLQDLHGLNALLTAVLNGDEHISKKIIEKLNSQQLGAGANNGMTALHIAVGKKNAEIVELLAHKMTAEDIFKKDSDGRTPLHYAALFNAPDPILKTLAQKMRDEDRDIKDKEGRDANDVAREVKNIMFEIRLNQMRPQKQSNVLEEARRILGSDDD